MNQSRPNLSIVVPLYNEVENAQPLYDAIHQAVAGLGRTFEIILVDDGSTDDTMSELLRIQKQDPHVRVIEFRKNFGQTAAMRAGIRAARGAVIVTMDGDLQNDPRDIPKLISGIDDGNDLVLGWRKYRKDPVWSRILPSQVANRLIGWITGVNVHDSGCSLKAYRSGMIKRIPLYSEMHRFIPAMSTLQSARISEVVVNHFPRERGVSKYGLSRIGKVLLDVIAIKMLISFRHRPLRYFTYMAIPFFALASIAGSVDLFVRVLHPGSVHLVTSITGLLFLYLAIHLIFVGLLAELIVQTGMRSQLTSSREEVPRGG